MSTKSIYTRRYRRFLSAVGILAAIVLLPLTAIAGECPADKVKAGATKPVDHAETGVNDDVLSTIDLAVISKDLAGRAFRLRRLVVQPGGVVSWHSHGERPANIYIVEGSITEYRANCSVPIEHKAGDAIPEAGPDHSHWWKNNTDKSTVLISADIITTGAKNKHGM